MVHLLVELVRDQVGYQFSTDDEVHKSLPGLTTSLLDLFVSYKEKNVLGIRNPGVRS